MNDKKNNNELFQEQNVAKLYIGTAMPLTLSLIVTVIYGIVDTFFVARTGNTDLVAAVSLCGPIFSLQMALGNMFAQGGSSLISRLLGQNEGERVSHVSAFVLYAALVVGSLIGILMLIFTPQVLILLGTNKLTVDYARSYLRVIAVGSPFAVTSYIHTNLLRSEGMAKHAMVGNIGGSVLNMILDPFFIKIWGAAGAAFATVLGYVFTVAFCFVIVYRKSRMLSVRPKDVVVNRFEIGQVFGIGIPASLSNIMMTVASVMTNQFLVKYGNDRIAALGISGRGTTIISLVLIGFTFGGAPLFGYFYGAKDKKRLAEIYRFAVKFICSLAISASILIFIIAPSFVRAFMDNEMIVYHGTLMLRLHVVTMVFTGMISLYSILFQSTGKIRASFFLSLARQGLIFIPVLVIMSTVFGYIGTVIAQNIADVISFVCAFIIFKKILWDDFHQNK